MQLIKVYSNKKSFKTVEFNLTGPNFIIAKQKDSNSNEKGKTYNGVGKSLLVRIIHFCLGASKKDYTSFCEKLSGWEFSLDFKIDEKTYTATRKTAEPNKIYLNGEKYTLVKFNALLKDMCFSVPSDVTHISFRSLLPFFIRPTKKSYDDCKDPIAKGTEYQKLLYNSFLLGLDVTLAQKKYKIKKEQDRIATLEGNFSKDSLLKDFFTGDKDASLTVIDLSDKIKKLEQDLKAFKVAENYHQVQKEANNVEKTLFNANNKIVLIRNNIENIERSLQISPTMKMSDIEAVYAEAKISFSDSVKKTLIDIDRFHKKLITNRIRRLTEQRNHLRIEIASKTEESSKLKIKLDSLMEYLGEHQALDLFLSIGKQCAELKSQKDSLEKYQNLLSEYKLKARQAEKSMIELSDITDNYLREIEIEVADLRDYFRNLAKEFYPDSVSGLTIKTNEGENQLLYDIDTKIESDASDGIHNVKIFCYDLTILLKGHNHNVNFIFHDSRLFDGTDPRQKATMFQIMYNLFFGTQYQYIATVNQYHLEEIKKQLLPQDYDEIINKNIILALTDESDSEKLLGIKVDIG